MLTNWIITQDDTSQLVLEKGKYKIIRKYISPNPRAWEGAIVVDVYENNQFLTSRNNLKQALIVIGENQL